MAPPRRPWFRFYVEAVKDRKIRRLKPETRWLFVACLAAARESPVPGWLLVTEGEPMDWEDLADVACLTQKQVEAGTDALTDSGILAFDEDRRAWYLPNWDKRQFESDETADRAAKSRRIEDDVTPMQRPIDGDRPHDVTPPENREQKTDTYTSAFEQFWATYPRRVEKRKAFKAWQARLRQGVSSSDLILASKHYGLAMAGTEERFIKHPATFLGPDAIFEEWLKPKSNNGHALKFTETGRVDAS